MEGVPFVGDDARAHNLLLKGRPLIMRLQRLLRSLPVTRGQASEAADQPREESSQAAAESGIRSIDEKPGCL